MVVKQVACIDHKKSKSIKDYIEEKFLLENIGHKTEE